MGSRLKYHPIGGDAYSTTKPVPLKGPHSYRNLKLTIDEEDDSFLDSHVNYQGPSNLRDDLFPQMHGGLPPDEHHATQDVNRNGQISNLDDFFCRIYEYHQRGGFGCMLLEDCVQLFQFVFVVFFSVFLLQCVDYDILFSNKLPPHKNGSRTEKLHLSEAIISILLWRVCVGFYDWRGYSYNYRNTWKSSNSLPINYCDLCNLTWYELAAKLVHAQDDTPFCINQSQITELDISMRILRRNNYFVALVNQGILPPKIDVPFFGEICIFTNGLKLNLEWLLFTGPWAPWSDYFTLRKEYKRRENLAELVANFDGIVLWLGLGNLLLSPLVLLWTVLYSFFSYAELLKRQPGALGTRKWSLYGRYNMRHFNELDHEMVRRLNRGFRPATQYLDLFTSKFWEIIAKNVAFIAASFFVVLAALSVWDEDVIEFEHVLTAMTAFGAIVYAAKIFIPDENLIWCPELLMQAVLAQTHYMPDTWKGHTHTDEVKRQFSQNFQFKMSFLLEELLSALTTPFILLLWVRPRVGQLLDFFNRYTCSVPGLGDVCSYSTMDIDKHGDPQWNNEYKQMDMTPESDRAWHGKTEISLANFKLRNPAWNPKNPNSAKFLSEMRRNMLDEANELNTATNVINDNPLGNSINSLLMGGLCSIAPAPGEPGSMVAQMTGTSVRGRGVSHTDGPLVRSGQGSVLGSVLGSVSGMGQGRMSLLNPTNASVMEQNALEMSLNALYLHNMHNRNIMARRSSTYGAIAETHDGRTAQLSTNVLFNSADENDFPPNTFRPNV